MPIVAQTGTYTPRIEKITQQGSELLLMVGYIPPETLWTAEQALRKDGEAQPDKYMIYVLEKNANGDYFISAIRDTANAGVPQYIGDGSATPALPDNMVVDEESMAELEEQLTEIQDETTEGEEALQQEEPVEE